MVEEMLAARGIVVSHETVRQWALKFGRGSPTKSGGACPRPGTSGTSMRSSSRSRDDALAVARRRPAWHRARRPGSEPARCESRQAVASQAPEAAGASAAGHDHRQAGAGQDLFLIIRRHYQPNAATFERRSIPPAFVRRISRPMAKRNTARSCRAGGILAHKVLVT